MSKSGAYIFSDNSLTFVYGKEVRTVSSTNPYFEKIVKAVQEGKFDKAVKLADIKIAFKSALGKKAEIKDGLVYYNGEPIHTYLANKIIEFADKEYDVKYLLNFMDNVMENPLKSAQEELYQFLEAGKMPITEDGCFLAYKNVNDDFTDVRTGKFDYTPGKYVEMEREKVCSHRNQTCAPGLHFCSAEYLPSYVSGKTIIVKINPKDVVSIPEDYNNSKGRACKMLSVQEYEGGWRKASIEDRLKNLTVATKELKEISPKKKSSAKRIKKLAKEVNIVEAVCSSCGATVSGSRSTFKSGHGKKCPNCGNVLKGKNIIW